MKKLARIVKGIVLLAVVSLVGAWTYYFAIPNLASPIGRGPIAGPWYSRWQPVFDGVEYLRADIRIPRPISVHAVRVDLSNPEVSMIVTPQTGGPGSTVPSRRATTFIKEFGCQVAINAGLFFPKAYFENEPVQASGLTASLGYVYAEPASNLHALVISSNKVISITKQLPEVPPYHAAGGLLTILEEGKNVGERLDPDPLTVVGYSDDQRYLYLMVIDGRQEGYSEGASPHEAAEMISKLGASDAINMDGGSSTTMAMENVLGGATVINRPSKRLFLNSIERPVATHIGIYAPHLE